MIVLAALLAAQAGAFVVTLGTDTIAIERFTRTAGRLEGDLITRGQVPVVRRHYDAALRPDGTVERLELTNTRLFAGGATTLGLRTEVAFTGDSAIGRYTLGDSVTPFRVAVPAGAMPFFHEESFAMYELYGRRARTLGGAQVRMPAANLDGEDFTLTAAFPRADSMTIGFGDSPPIRFRVDGAGGILSVDGRATTDKVMAARAATLDFDALARRFGGRPLGVLSPPDSVRATIGGVTIAVDYSRPAVRGRKIFGETVVPWNQVWRTGANEATRFTTSADLVVGGRTIPAGTYTLWTIPAAPAHGAWTLIFNRQTKAPCRDAAQCNDPRRPPLWGTDYSRDSDFVRVDMQTAPLPQPVERFTIRVAPSGTGGVLQLEWETTRASIAFSKR